MRSDMRAKAMRFICASLLIALMMIATANCSAINNTCSCSDISPEKKVAYMCRPAVVMINCLHWATLVNKDGEPKIYLNIGDGDQKTEVDFQEWGQGGTGSGFIISQDGYIMTNAHVIYMSDYEIKEGLVKSIGDSILNNYPQIAGENGQYSEEIYDVLRKEYTLKKRTPEKEISVYFGGMGSITEQNGVPAEVRTESPDELWVGEGNNKYRSGKDLAILKIEGFSNLPTVILGDSGKMEVGDKVIIIGYPGLVESYTHQMLSAETDLIPTVTSGIISAQRKHPDHTDVFQTDAAIQHGNSGGPAFNKDGEVIGIATWGSSVPDAAILVQGYNFLIPINVAKSFINQLNINTSRSKASEFIEKGLDYYWKQQYSNAAQEFNKALSLDTKNYYASEYLKMSSPH